MAPSVLGGGITKIIATLLLAQLTSAVYFYAEPEKWRCFKDTVVSNYVRTFWLQIALDTWNGGIGFGRGSAQQYSLSQRQPKVDWQSSKPGCPSPIDGFSW